MPGSSANPKIAPAGGTFFSRKLTQLMTQPVSPKRLHNGVRLNVPPTSLPWGTTVLKPGRIASFIRAATVGLVSGRCVNDGPRGYLSIRTNADPADKRTDRVGGEVGAMGFFLPGWGMHMSDVNEAQGDIMRAIERVTSR